MSPHRRRREILLRVITYIVMTVSVVALVAVCIFLVLGYSVDQKTGQPEQGGLIQFRTFPEGASVRVDGSKLSFTTPGKTNTNAGRHSVEMNKDKYRSWSKSFTISRGELLWLNALLVPTAITTDSIVEFENLYNVKASPDKKWIAVIEKPNEPIVKLIDLRDEKKPKITALTLPVGTFKAVTPNDAFRVAEWDFGSRYMLVQHISGQSIEWIRVDRSDISSTKNITSQLKLNISDAHFVGNGGNVFYALGEGVLRKIDIGNGSISAPVASNVQKFELYRDDRISYVGRENSIQVVGVYKEGMKQPKVVKNFADETPVNTTLNSYFDDEYIAISHGVKVEILKDPFDKAQKVAEFEFKENATWLFFASSGRFLIAQNGSTIHSYDLERKQHFTFVIPGNPVYTLDHHLEWLDDFHLWSDVGNRLVIMEFDGSNAETIGDVSQGYDITLSDNGKRLFSIGTNSATKRPILQSSVMVLE